MISYKSKDINSKTMLENFPISKLNKESFPEGLLEIPDCPQELFIRGKLPDKSFIKLAVVGARNYSSYCKEVCRKLILGLQGYPVCIVSGLALGIDAIAHEAALDARLPTVAIPGSGLDLSVIHPKQNINLAREILEKGGCLLSEMKPEDKATIWSFPMRNRIMAGISKATLVIEAEKKSGTLITAKLATEYNRDVLTVPGSIFSSNSEGPLLLLKLGATPIASVEDLLEALGLENKSVATQQKLFDDLTPDEQIIFDVLIEPLTRDEIQIKSSLPISKLNMALTLLELRGAIKEIAGKIIRQ